jgi:hypothetical protein
MRLNRLTILVLAGAGLCAGAPAYAQVGNGSLLNINRNHVPANNQTRKIGPMPPPALPGAQSNPADVAPPSQPPADMSPTDALFDAINRGDIAAARDALSRGADLHQQNVLGMTPLELSVDLGRNDISFLLLSMGAAEHNPAAPPRQEAGKQGRASTASARQMLEQHAPASSRRAATPAPKPAPPRAPALFAGNGGSPNPEAGFLGFDSRGR